MNLAIVIPYYKIAFFEESLVSLANQTNKNFRLYIGNDASPDDPEELIQQYSSKIDLDYKRFPENLGKVSLTKQWDRCLKMTQGEEWFMILGDDDYLGENFVEEFYAKLGWIQENYIKVVRAATRIKYEDSGEFTGVHKHPEMEMATDFFYRRFSKSLYSSLSEYIFNFESYRKYGFKELSLGWGADIVAWFEFADQNYLYTLNDTTAYIRISSENISREGFSEKLKLEAKASYFSYIVTNYLYRFNRAQRAKILHLYLRNLCDAKMISSDDIFNILKELLKNGNYLKAVECLTVYAKYRLEK